MKKDHNQCIDECQNRLSDTHSCLRESHIFRDGEIHRLDLECHPTSENLNRWRKTAIECESSSSKLQQRSNLEDLKQWKAQNPDGVGFQITDPSQFNKELLRKRQITKRKFFTRRLR